MLSRRSFLLTAHRLGVQVPTARTQRAAVRHRFQNVKKSTDLMSIRGVNLDKDMEFLYIVTSEMTYFIPVDTPDLHTRIAQCVQDFLALKGTAIEVKPDLPYTTVEDQIAGIGLEVPPSSPECHKILKDLRESEPTTTTKDYGDAFIGEYIREDEVYVRLESSDFAACKEMMDKYPMGKVYEKEGDVLVFVYGCFRGASSGLCPPINPAVFAGATEPFDESLDKLKAIGQEYKDLVAEQEAPTNSVDPALLRQVQRVNDWLNAQKYGHYFNVGVDGQLVNPRGLGDAYLRQGRFNGFLAALNKKAARDRETAFFGKVHRYNDAVAGHTKASRIIAYAIEGSHTGKVQGKDYWDYSMFLHLILRAAMKVYQIKDGKYLPKDASVIKAPRPQTWDILDKLY